MRTDDLWGATLALCVCALILSGAYALLRIMYPRKLTLDDYENPEHWGSQESHRRD